MFEIGRVCVKIAGRDSKKICVVVDVLDEKYVLIDGQTRRRKCNVLHLEPLDKKVEIKKSASNKEVVEALKKAGIECEEKQTKEKKEKTEKPVKKRALKLKEKKKADKKTDKAKKEKSKEDNKKDKKQE